ncbi:hypothetical protein HDV04_004677 [Boothiomyces sp. JEL0838]|nr:hypothetical protein HDV04_004677 [Boothiomyces sp. JEL0838]
MKSIKFKVTVITVSDRVSRGEAIDKSGPAICEWLNSSGKFVVKRQVVVPDEPEELLQALNANLDVNLILTSGGTGFGVRDITPEVVKRFIEKEASGFTIAMITNSLQITPLAALSRPICGVKQNTSVITLPGSTKGALENIKALETVIPHALELISGEKNAGESFHKNIGVSHSCVHHHSAEKVEGILSNDPTASGSILLTIVTKRARISPFPMVEYADALQMVLDETEEISQVIKLPVNENLVGYTVAEDIFSKESVPAFRASIVDGYAVKSSSGAGVFKVQADIVAGHGTSNELQEGCIIRITTGAPVPNGADAVVMVEDTKLKSFDGDIELEVELSGKIIAGQNIRPIGSDLSVGELLLKKGQKVTSIGGEIGILASGGIKEILVVRKPVVAVLSTGNELFDISDTKELKFGAVRDANRPTLKAALASVGYEVIDLGIQSDEVDGLLSLLKKGLEKADIVITTGGVSMGEKDLMKPILERYLQAKIHFGRVNLKPGKPTTFATLSSGNSKKNIFCLPGNPVSALVTFYLFVLPALKKMSGLEKVKHTTLKVKAHYAISLDSRPEFQRVVVKYNGQDWIATGTGNQISSRITSFLNANALLKLPSSKERKTIATGELIDAYLLEI